MGTVLKAKKVQVSELSVSERVSELMSERETECEIDCE